jgi:hypothetical protein
VRVNSCDQVMKVVTSVGQGLNFSRAGGGGDIAVFAGGLGGRSEFGA